MRLAVEPEAESDEDVDFSACGSSALPWRKTECFLVGFGPFYPSSHNHGFVESIAHLETISTSSRTPFSTDFSWNLWMQCMKIHLNSKKHPETLETRNTFFLKKPQTKQQFACFFRSGWPLKTKNPGFFGSFSSMAVGLRSDLLMNFQAPEGIPAPRAPRAPPKGAELFLGKCLPQFICARVDQLPILGMVIPPLIGNPYNGYINTYYWVDEFITYHRETMGVSTTAHIYFPHWKRTQIPWTMLALEGLLTRLSFQYGQVF